MIVTTASPQLETKSAGVGFRRTQADAQANSQQRLVRSTGDATAPRTVRNRAVRSVDLRGPAGRLEALLNDGSPDAPCAALVCHPHPKGGGNLHNKVVYHAMKAINDPAWGLGLPVLRFNFRGTGLSEGAHDGQAETGDVLAALDWLENEFRLPVVAAGFSFGAAMALRACCTGDAPRNVHALIALGLPVEAEGRTYDYSFLHDAFLPKLFLSGDQDRFAPAARLKQIAASAADPKKLALLSGADHFFTGQLEPMQRALSDWLKEQF
jgi:alpha/beta superfamily hydrolase